MSEDSEETRRKEKSTINSEYSRCPGCSSLKGFEHEPRCYVADPGRYVDLMSLRTLRQQGRSPR